MAAVEAAVAASRAAPGTTLPTTPASRRLNARTGRGRSEFTTSVAWDRFNADAHNWLGFAYRNAGDLKRAFAEYEEALRLDPQHKGAHEYVGEAYVIAKEIPKAEEHLAALEKLCGRSCPEYKDLDETIRKAKNGG